MALRKAIPLTFRPKGLSDALDGSNVFAGAMSILSNLVPAPSTPNVYVPRPAEQKVYDFAAFSSPGIPTLLFLVGNFAWGMVPSARFTGKDEPFCVNLLTGNPVTISGVTSANCPATQATTGDWTPPTMASFPDRLMVTHPGFAGGSGDYLGWFDISGFTSTSLTGNITSGSNVIASIQDSGATSAPISDGVMPGMTISGPGIPANATVVSVSNGTFNAVTTGTFNAGSAAVTGIPSTTGMSPGMAVNGVGPATGAVVSSVDSATQITMSAAAISSGVGSALIVSGGGSITISANATATTSGIALSIAGGTPAAPLWGAGNLNSNPLTSVPVAVAEYSGRAWYAVQNYAVFSDTLNPTQVTNASQALSLGDSTAVTALCGLPLTNQVTGGSLQSLIAFKGAEVLFQITGDEATNNLAQSAIEGSVGTVAPNSIATTPLGIAFMAPDGFRILGLSGTLSEPIGIDGKGVFIPFANALYPSRMAAAYEQNTYRITVQNNALPSQPLQEYWYDFNTKGWSGPHTFTHALLAPYHALPGFIGVGSGISAALWESTVFPVTSSTYTENGNPMTWTWQTSLLPDNERMAMNQVCETALGMSLSTQDTVAVSMLNETGADLSTIYVAGVTGGLNSANWNAQDWGSFNWGVTAGAFEQYAVPWDNPLVFKQAFLKVTGTSAANQAIGNAYMRYQICDYMLGAAYTPISATTPFVLDESQLDGPNVLQ